MEDLGYIPVNATIDVQWNTRLLSTGASVTRATNGTIRIYKANSTTQRTSSSGITDTEDFDSLTGVHNLRIDLSDNADSGFYADGSTYHVVVEGMVIGGATINATLFRFRIGTQPVNVIAWDGQTLFAGLNAGVPVVDLYYWRGTVVPVPNTAGHPTVDVTRISGDTAAADNAEAFFDGTGYAGGTIKLGVDAVAISGDSAAADNLEAAYDGAGYAGGTIKPQVDLRQIGGDAQSATDLKDFADAGYDPSTNKVQGVVLTDTATTVTNRVTANVDQLGGDAQSLTDLKDFADAGYDPATNKVEGVKFVDTLTTYTGNTPQTGDAYAIVNNGTHGNSALHGILTNTGAKVGSFAVDAITADAIHADAVTKIQNGLATSVSQATILDRIGAFTGTGVNNILGFFRALMRSDATTPSDVGGTYDDATDSTQAIADQLASLPTSGPGPWGVVINVKSGGVNIQNADVTATNGSESYHAVTNSSGNASFSLPTDDWDFYVYKPNYVQDDPPYEKSVTTHSLSGNNVTMTYDPPGQELTEEDPTMTATFLTAYDAVQHLRNVLGGASGDDKNDNFRQAFRFAHDEFFADDQFKESLLQHRVQLQTPYSTGTIAFDLTGGSSERLVTLTGGTFPSWAARGTLVIDDVLYRVVARLSNTTLQLDETFCPTEDAASGTSYTLYQADYLLPADFSATYQLNDRDGWCRRYVSEEDWLHLTTVNRFAGSDFRFTIMFDDRAPGRYALKFWGYPNEARAIDFLYKRKRKTPVLDGTEAETTQGTIAWTSGGTTVTGSGTAFDSSMIGSVLRIGTSSNHPTHLAGRYPYKGEYIVSAVASTTSLTVKTAIDLTTASSIKYRITDPLSLDRANHVALLKGCEAQYHVLANSGDSLKRSALSAYNDALMRAKEQQSRHREIFSPVSSPRSGSGRPSVNVNAPS